MKALDGDSIAWAAQLACLLEVSADKPGNVTWGKSFWDAHYVDFMTSAVAIGPALRDAPQRPVGETILCAVRDTQRFVSTNTNLGMLLLLAPLAKAAGRPHPNGLRAAVGQVLRALTVDDARQAFEAIRLAAPGGLGDSDVHDVHAAKVRVTLLEAMRAARGRDAVAREYVTDFEITFGIGYAALCRFLGDGRRFSDAIVQTALTILAQVPDTLIVRKEGLTTARAVSRQAARVLQAGGAFSRQGRQALEAFDRSIRDEEHRLNPGTTADLTTASIFVMLVEAEGLEPFPSLLARW
jgi:triphosphoribosyl-dephospho-CoA synthase